MGCFTSKPRVRPSTESENPGSVLPTVSDYQPTAPDTFKIKPGQFIQYFKVNFFQNYRVIRELGVGSFGKVYEVEHRITKQHRAIKELEKSTTEKDTNSKFISEVDIVSRLDHPHILKLFELYEDSMKYYVVSELLTGGELFDYIIKVGHLSESSASNIMQQVLSAVAYCHKNNIVHRDLKPENLVLESDPSQGHGLNIKLIDFGTSSLFSSSEHLHMKIGTPYYIAPEVLRMDYDEKCDVWSCGVILYVLLSGRSPFPGRSNEEILRKVRIGDFSFSFPEFDHVSLEAKSLIRSMLTMNPADRISAAQAMDHPWIANVKTARKTDETLALTSLRQLRHFRADQKLKQAALTFITGQLLSQEQTKQLREEFKSLDANSDGRLSKDELIRGYEKSYSHEQAVDIVESVMKKVDADHNGFIDYTEFLTASFDLKKLASRSNVESVFRAFDKDGSGKITIQELKEMFSAQKHISESTWQQLLREADRNNDGEIDLHEFITLMM